MNETLSTYSFLPWLRQGLANSIKEDDHDPAVILRAGIDVKLNLAVTQPGGSVTTASVTRDIRLYGPGDITGIDSRAIVKTEPLNMITNFEPNYLPYIDFYDEDFPWRYTPARPQKIYEGGGTPASAHEQRLRPWICLVTLSEEEFEDVPVTDGRPLPGFRLKGVNAGDIFPKADDLWAWAHVHVNTDLLDDAALPDDAGADRTLRENIDTVLAGLLEKDPDMAWSRIISPRKLAANTGYHVFLIPSFESGRLAGLGRDLPGDLQATESAWENVGNNEFPYYYRWYFRTGNVGDFEYLVGLLKPMVADKSVGVRDMDVLHIGSNLPDIEDDPGESDESKLLGGVLKLGGALRVPLKEPGPGSPQEETDYYNEVKKYDEWAGNPYPYRFVDGMARRINLADGYTAGDADTGALNTEAGIPQERDQDGQPVDDPDPVITSPLYGRWHALTTRLLYARNGNPLPHGKNWIHELNLDPRFRAAAGFGTNVVQKHQEEYMQAAWEQVGDIVEEHNRMRMAQAAKEVSVRLHIKHLLPLDPEQAIIFTAPVSPRVVYKDLTVYRQVADSVVPPAVLKGPFRRATRRRGRLMGRISFNGGAGPGNLLERINEGMVTAAPPVTDPAGATGLDDIAGSLSPSGIPAFLARWLKKYPWLRFMPLILLILIAIIAAIFSRTPTEIGIPAAVLLALVWLHRKMAEWHRKINASGTIGSEGQTPEAVDRLPKNPGFRITEPGTEMPFAKGNADSAEATAFKAGLKDAYTMLGISFAGPERHKLDLKELAGAMVTSLDPAVTIRARTLASVKIPGRLLDNLYIEEYFTPVLAYPEIDLPMYRPLADISSDLFLPNINKIKENSITLLESNQRFIESYLAGINHEMSRELLWREYPTDQRGTCFRQFWDVSGFLPSTSASEDEIREQLRDIPPMHRWPLRPKPADPLRNRLGRNNHRAQGGGEAQIVLVIRGELLKKYPTAVVYAHKAAWKMDDGVPDFFADREFAELSDTEKSDPPRTKIKTPLFEAKVEPDIYFLGFDLTLTEAMGAESPTSAADNPGWFFIIKERPGEPRFGLDVRSESPGGGSTTIGKWNDLSWSDVRHPGGQPIDDGECIDLQLDIPVAAPGKEDRQASWGPGTNSAELAYILYQVPVLVGIHASRMLP